jgi:hypothetical protein
MRIHVIPAQAGIHFLSASEIPHASHYQFNRSENWIWREFSAELMLPKFEVP